MKFLTLSYLAWGLAIGTTGSMAQQPWHSQFSGTDIQVHRVVLKGQSSIEKSTRESLVQSQKGCQGKPQKLRATIPPPTVETVPHVPDIVTPVTLDLYYSPTQTLTVSRQVNYRVDLGNCELVPSRNTTASFHSARGACTISLQAPDQGYCNEKVKALNLPIPSVNLPALAKAQNHAEQISRTDEVRTIANMQCALKRLPLLKHEVCIAQPTASPTSVFPSGLNLTYPGLLLQARTAMDLDATEVQLGLTVPSGIYNEDQIRAAVKRLAGQRSTP